MKKRFQPMTLVLALLTPVLALLTPILALLTLSLSAIANEGDIEIKPVKVVEPEVERRDVKEATIDTGLFEVGALVGFLAVEDFNSNSLYGVSGSYHFSKRWMLQINYGRSEVEKATIEEVIDSSFLSDDDRNFEYYNVLGGYNVFPGRSFLGTKSKYDSGLYLLAGIGSTRFAGDSSVTLVLGSSYRVVIADWLVGNLDFRNHIMEREFLDDNKFTHNIELSVGLNVLF